MPRCFHSVTCTSGSPAALAPFMTHMVSTSACLQRISGLDACHNLCELDLASNAIHTISGISSLTSLRKLVLANNRISYVSGLEGLLRLEHLLLHGNRLQQLESVNLSLLKTLPNLRSVYLKNSAGSEVCGQPLSTY
jgi:Leucine-rich repeat (LRR) protein